MNRMKSYIIISSVLLLLLPAHINADSDTSRILFLGTSYTFYNNMPNQVRSMAINHENVQPVHIDSITFPGSELDRFLENKEVISKIRDGQWDIVIVQGGSLETLTSPNFFLRSAEGLAEIIGQSGARMFLFETYARAPGDPVYAEEWSGGNPGNMQKKISDVYAKAALICEADVIPVGSLLTELSETQDDFLMFDSDLLHPSYHGSYLTACVIFASVFEESPVSLSYKAYGITDDEADRIRRAAEEVLLSLQDR